MRPRLLAWNTWRECAGQTGLCALSVERIGRGGRAGGTIFFIGLGSGNPYVMAAGSVLTAIGGGLILYDWVTTPGETIEDAKDKLVPVTDAMKELSDQIEKIENGKEEDCP